MVAYPLEKLGEVYRWRGQWALARACFEEAVAQAEAAGDLQGLVPALSGLARVVVADEPDEAERLVERALALGQGMNHVQVLAHRGLGGSLARGARRAPPSARRTRPRLRGRDATAPVSPSRSSSRCSPLRAPRRRRERLEEAAAIWRELGKPDR